MQPYPYGDGYERDASACNFDNLVPSGMDVFKARDRHDGTSEHLRTLLTVAGGMERCVSPFGVHDMVGNVDEWVSNESKKPYASALAGGHVFGVRNACRPMTVAHDESFAWYETGTRCCDDIAE